MALTALDEVRRELTRTRMGALSRNAAPTGRARWRRCAKREARTNGGPAFRLLYSVALPKHRHDQPSWIVLRVHVLCVLSPDLGPFNVCFLRPASKKISSSSKALLV